MITKLTHLFRWDTQANGFIAPPNKKLPNHMAQISQKILPIVAAYAQITPDDFMTTNTTKEMKMFHSIYVGLMWESDENVKKSDIALTLNCPVPYVSNCLKLFVRANNNYEKMDADYRFALKKIKWKIKEFDIQKKEQEEKALALRFTQNKFIPDKYLVVAPIPNTFIKQQFDAIHLMNHSEWKIFANVVRVDIFSELLFDTINRVFDVSKEDICSKESTRKIVFARIMFSVIVNNTYLFAVHLNEIGQLLGGKDHSMISYYLREHKNYVHHKDEKVPGRYFEYKLGFAHLEMEFFALLKERFNL